jgi:hypothetical protein
LAGCGKQQRLGNDRELPTYLHVGGYVAHSGERSDAQTAVRQRLDLRHMRQAIDIQKTVGKRCTILD